MEKKQAQVLGAQKSPRGGGMSMDVLAPVKTAAVAPKSTTSQKNNFVGKLNA